MLITHFGFINQTVISSVSLVIKSRHTAKIVKGGFTPITAIIVVSVL